MGRSWRIIWKISRATSDISVRMLQGGIHPNFDGNTYLAILAAAKKGAPGIHVHAFSPLEVMQGAATLGWALPRYRLHRILSAPLHAAGMWPSMYCNVHIVCTLCWECVSGDGGAIFG